MTEVLYSGRMAYVNHALGLGLRETQRQEGIQAVLAGFPSGDQRHRCRAGVAVDQSPLRLRWDPARMSNVKTDCNAREHHPGDNMGCQAHLRASTLAAACTCTR